MRDYYGVYRSKDGSTWAGREGRFSDDVVALNSMKFMTITKVVENDEGELKEKRFSYELDYLLCGKRVVFNG